MKDKLIRLSNIISGEVTVSTNTVVSVKDSRYYLIKGTGTYGNIDIRNKDLEAGLDDAIMYAKKQLADYKTQLEAQTAAKFEALKKAETA